MREGSMREDFMRENDASTLFFFSNPSGGQCLRNEFLRNGCHAHANVSMFEQGSSFVVPLTAMLHVTM